MSGWNVPEKVGSILDGILSDRGYLTLCREYEVVSRWDEIAGATVAKVTRSVKLENSILYVTVKNAAWRQEVSYFKKDLLDKIVKITGCTTIRDIVFC